MKNQPGVERKESRLFSRFKKNHTEREQFALDGINDDELQEFKEAFRLFDKVHFAVLVINKRVPSFTGWQRLDLIKGVGRCHACIGTESH